MSESVAIAEITENQHQAADPELAPICPDLTRITSRPSCWWKRSRSTACAVSTETALTAGRGRDFDLDRPW